MRGILRIKWHDRLRNEELWRRTGQRPVEEEIRMRRWSWIGHTLRKPHNNITRQALQSQCKPQGNRDRGSIKYCIKAIFLCVGCVSSYMCDEYILGDNSRKDVEAIRSALTDIGTLSLEEMENKGGLLLRTYSHQQEFSRSQADENDRLVTAICHHRKSLLGKVLSAWQAFVYNGKRKLVRLSIAWCIIQ
ncbi:ubiquitin carboxyl-terminal hydrolase 44 [Elysia marginata]|uniref:Ubiquitin carboxyl-terminal hydrolase 44 n=1 Tax=Elysia marginata TaxID=1093978 RepID=A0AAV4GBJ9_9GAST|nr:ubiquitin carboxyl-terminal hydrolase 44 [Elysia marginata]